MRFMNDYDVEYARRLWRDHPVLGPASQTLENLKEWTNSHSDGWAYWPKPARAAAKLMELLEQGRQWEREQFSRPRTPEPTVDQLKTALRPIRAFRTRQKADFEIAEVS